MICVSLSEILLLMLKGRVCVFNQDICCGILSNVPMVLPVRCCNLICYFTDFVEMTLGLEK